MLRSQNLAVVFLLGATLVGGAGGVMVDRILVKERLCALPVGTRNPAELFFDDLGFSKEQRDSWNAILDERQKTITAILAPMRDRADSVRERYRPLMLQLLTPEQRTKLEARELKMKEERERMSRERKQP